MAISFRHSVVTRALVLILTITAVFSGVAIVYSYYSSKSQVEEISSDLVQSLVETVLPSVQIACFVNDDKLAKELAKGLLLNDFIYKVVISDNTNAALAESSKGPLGDNIVVLEERIVFSPFDKTEVVGKINVWLDQKQLQSQSRKILSFAIYPLVIQICSIALALILVVWFVIRPKSRELMEQIESVNIDQADKLGYPAGEQHSEIGVLVSYINRLIERMYNILSQERELQALQTKEHKRFQSIFDNAQTGIFMVNRQGDIQSINRACQQLGIYNDSSTLAKTDFFKHLAGNDEALHEKILDSLEQQKEFTFEVSLANNRSHTSHWYQINLTPIDNDSIQGIINDITTLKSESILAYNLARTDSLTSLGNRMGLDDELTRRLSEERSGEHSLTIMMIDLDRFKQVNDSLGHHAGDEVLTHIANRLRAAIRDVDYAARPGGDEFIVLLNDMKPNQTAQIAARLISLLNQKILLKDGNITSVGASIGIVYAPKGYNIDTRDLVQKADEAMYSVKKSGRNFFNIVDLSQPDIALHM